MTLSYKKNNAVLGMLLISLIVAKPNPSYGDSFSDIPKRPLTMDLFQGQALSPVSTFNRDDPKNPLYKHPRLIAYSIRNHEMDTEGLSSAPQLQKYLSDFQQGEWAYFAGKLDNADHFINSLLFGDPQYAHIVGLQKFHEAHIQTPFVTELFLEASLLQRKIIVIRESVTRLENVAGPSTTFKSDLEKIFLSLSPPDLLALFGYIRAPMLRRACDLRRSWDQNGHALKSPIKQAMWIRLKLILTGFNNQLPKLDDTQILEKAIIQFANKIVAITGMITFQKESDMIFRKLLKNNYYVPKYDDSLLDSLNAEARVTAALVSHYQGAEALWVEDILAKRWEANPAMAIEFLKEFLKKEPFPKYLYPKDYIRQAEDLKRWTEWELRKPGPTPFNPFSPMAMIPKTAAAIKFETYRQILQKATNRQEKTYISAKMKEIIGYEVPKDPAEVDPFEKYIVLLSNSYRRACVGVKEREAFTSFVKVNTKRAREVLAQNFALAHTAVFWFGRWWTNRGVLSLARWILRGRANRWMEEMADEFYLGWRNTSRNRRLESPMASDYARQRLFSMHGESNLAKFPWGLIGMSPGKGWKNGRGWFSQAFARAG